MLQAPTSQVTDFEHLRGPACHDVGWVSVDFAQEIDLLALLSSLNGSGEYPIWTCTCGIAECAGMERGVGVIHTATTVVFEAAELPFDSLHNLTFDRSAYAAAVRGIWAEYVRYYKSYRAAGLALEPCPGLFEAELVARMNQQ